MPGDDIYVSTEGDIAHFRVVRAAVYPEDTDRMDEILGAGAGDGVPQLNLITCEGVWNQAVRRYDERLVVFTELARD
jgi:sortase (surface protein transpeptidase)